MKANKETEKYLPVARTAGCKPQISEGSVAHSVCTPQVSQRPLLFNLASPFFLRCVCAHRVCLSRGTLRLLSDYTQITCRLHWDYTQITLGLHLDYRSAGVSTFAHFKVAIILMAS